MICKHCNTENPDGAFYCSACGERLDGKQACLYCGAINEEGADYCASCGKLLGGKTECPNCKTVFKGTVCPSCGWGSEPLPEKQTSETWKKTFSLIASIAAIAAVLISVVFAFFIGYKTFVTFHGEELSSMLEELGLSSLFAESKFNLFYFFGQAYREIGETIAQYTELGVEISSFTNTMLYLYPVFGTVISAVVLLGVVFFAALTVFRFIRFLRYKTENNMGALACTTYFIYLAGALLIRGLYEVFYQMQYKIVSPEESIEMGVTLGTAFNGATLAGLIVGGFFVAVYLVCKLISRKDALKKSSLTSFIPAACGMVCLVLVAVFAGMAVCGISMSNTIGEEETFMSFGMTMKMGFPALLQTFGSSYATIPYDGKYNLLTTYSLLATIVLICIFLLVTVHLYALSRNFEQSSKTRLGVAIALYVLIGIYLALTILTTYELTGTSFTEGLLNEGIKFLYWPVIVACSFAELNLIASIVHFVLRRKNKE